MVSGTKKRNVAFKKRLGHDVYRTATDVVRLTLNDSGLTVLENNRLLAYKSPFPAILERKIREALRESLEWPAATDEAKPAA